MGLLHSTLIYGPSVDHPVTGSFWEMACGALFDAFLFRTECVNEKVISLPAEPFGARIS